jgi:hypothetical protein
VKAIIGFLLFEESLRFIRFVRTHNSTLPKQDARRLPESDTLLKKNVGLLPGYGHPTGVRGEDAGLTKRKMVSAL